MHAATGRQGGRYYARPMIETERVVSKGARLQPFILTGYQGAPTRGTVTIQAFNREQRWRRALAGLGKWWGIALLSVFIPVAHFLLVPSFFVDRKSVV